MLKLLIGPDWVANSDKILQMLAQDVKQQKRGRILIVPELISHDTERRLCKTAGNTSSRFAEVLTFSSLARCVSDTVGRGLLQCLDDGGRVVAMASAARQLHSKLKAYASVETKPEFLTSLVDAVDEFKRCCITPADLHAASRETEGVFAQKLEELSLLFEAYDSICAQGKRDPRDQMVWLLEQLEDSSFAQDHTFYIDGFPDFTRQNMDIVAYLISNAPNVTVTFNCDSIDSENPAFEKAADTARQILNLAKRAGIKFVIEAVQPEEISTQLIFGSLFQGKCPYLGSGNDSLQTLQVNSLHEECTAAAEKIAELVHSGARFRDIGIVATDMSEYGNLLRLVLSRFHIPFYISGTEDVLNKSIITTVLAALDTVLSGFSQADVLHYLKSALSPLDIETCDKLEDYAVIWNIQGNQWLHTWERHPEGLAGTWTQKSRDYLDELNTARVQALQPLAELELGLKSAKNLGQLVSALYAFLESIQLAERLSGYAQQMDEIGDNRSAQILNQLWEILLNALEQLYDVLGHTYWDLDTFVRLLRLLLGQYTVGTIPAVLDSVTVGPVSAMRCQRVKYLFVLGAVEGAFPSYGGISGVLTDQERSALRQMGVPLTGGAFDGLMTEFSEIYGVFCGCRGRIYISCPDEQPSFVFRRLADMSGEVLGSTDAVGPACTDPLEAAALLVRYGQEAVAKELGLENLSRQLAVMSEHELGSVERDTVTSVYGSTLLLSASQIDKFADCRLAYFLKYGLRVRERKTVQIDPAEFGTYVHAVLEKTGREVLESGGFQRISLAETLAIACKYSEQYAKEHFSQIDSGRNAYLLRRNGMELDVVVQELWNELQTSEFQPLDFEVAFGTGCQMDAIQIEGSSMQAQLRGFVDRVDAWQCNGRNYFRVVDYKTGKKDFDYCDIFNGLGLQMLLYLFALEHSGQSLLGGHPVPAGVQYFPARAPIITTDAAVTEEEAQEALQKLWKRKGLLLNDEQVLSAMESGDNPVRLSYTRKKDGSITGDLADRGQLRLLEKYIYRLLKKMTDEIASGNIVPNPYTRGNSHNACTFCPYSSVCHPEYVEGRRNYRTMTPQRFWEEIEKEMKELE